MHGQNLKESIKCNQGYLVSTLDTHLLCYCVQAAGTCTQLDHACYRDPTINSRDWLSVKGDPPFQYDFPGNPIPIGTLTTLLSYMGWVSIGRFCYFVTTDISNDAAIDAGMRMVTWQYLYAIIVAAFGGPNDAAKCYDRRKLFNFLVGHILAFLVILLNMMGEHRRVMKEIKRQIIAKLTQSTNRDERQKLEAQALAQDDPLAPPQASTEQAEESEQQQQQAEKDKKPDPSTSDIDMAAGPVMKEDLQPKSDEPTVTIKSLEQEVDAKEKSQTPTKEEGGKATDKATGTAIDKGSEKENDKAPAKVGAGKVFAKLKEVLVRVFGQGRGLLIVFVALIVTTAAGMFLVCKDQD
jgi:hypothetical protein